MSSTCRLLFYTLLVFHSRFDRRDSLAYEHCVTIKYQVIRIETSLQCKSFFRGVWGPTEIWVFSGSEFSWHFFDASFFVKKLQHLFSTKRKIFFASSITWWSSSSSDMLQKFRALSLYLSILQWIALLLTESIQELPRLWSPLPNDLPVMISGAPHPTQCFTGFCLLHMQIYCNRKFIMSILLVIPNWFISWVDSMEIIIIWSIFPNGTAQSNDLNWVF